MARFDRGWIKIYRKALLGDIGSNYTRSGLFGTLVAIANIQPSTVEWKGKPRRLERGQIVTSIAELASLGSTDWKTVSKHLNYLRLRETILIEKSKQGVLIRIVNFEQYQGENIELVQSGPITLADGMADGVRHIKEGKNNKKESSPFANPLYKNSNELKDAVPLHYREKWARAYPDKDWLERQYQLAHDFHTADPADMPRTPGQWMKKLITWLEMGWQNRRAPAANDRPVGLVPD